MADIGSFDVFLSHNSKDKPAVEYLAEKLKRAALEPWLDKWCLTPGGKWQQELEMGLRASSSCAVFLGPQGIGNWESEELSVALDRAAKDKDFRIFPVLLPGLPEPFDDSGLPPFLKMRTWVDLRRGLDDPWSFQILVHAIQGTTPGPVTAIPLGQEICPYRGLQTFDEEHAEFFFGREREVQRLLEKLKSTRFLAVLGASGSGKSSTVRAGLLPALRSGALLDSQTWNIRVFTPGAHPLTVLTSHLFRLYPQESMQKTLDQMIEDQRTLHLSVSLALIDHPGNERTVWVIDQFEEVFTLCEDEKERAQFFANLIYASSIPDGRNIVLLTLRADFFQKCAAYPSLSTQIAGQQFIVSPMDTEGLRRAIEEPARHVGLRFDEGLIDSILDDVIDQPGSLPLLEHALLELWGRRRGQMLTFKGYADSGGVQGAIAKRADAIFADFSAEQQGIAKQIMLRLTQPGEGTEDTRRRATIDELITHPEEATVVEKVVSKLTDERLLTTTDEQAYGQTVSVSHEALIRAWPRLRTWIEENRAGLRILRRLTEAAQEWQRLKRDKGALYRGARLAEVMVWREQNEAELNPLERGFIDASIRIQAREEEAERELQRHELEAAREQILAERQRRLATLGALIGALVLIVVIAYPQAQVAWLRQQALGSPLVFIPGSEALIGDSQNANEQSLNILPDARQPIAAFRIEPYEVTNQRYLLCVRAGPCSLPIAPSPSYVGSQNANLPVVDITAIQAIQFCQWLGRRLPSESEWERAARYTDGRQWPWGNPPARPELANFYYGEEPKLRPVGQYQNGKSPEGVSDLAGNVWEWTRSDYYLQKPDLDLTDFLADGELPDALSVRGGSYDTNPESAMKNTIAYRLPVEPFASNDAIGFRCASDLPK
jgi:formylglycine-generating enzyme required for sulfatase activity